MNTGTQESDDVCALPALPSLRNTHSESTNPSRLTISQLHCSISMTEDLAIQQLAISLGDVEIPFEIPDDPTGWINAERQQRREALNANLPIFSEEERANLTDSLVYPVSHPV